MTRDYRLIDRARFSGTDLQSHLIDGYAAGTVSRRDFMRHGSVLGLSLSLLGRIAGGGVFAAGAASTARAQAGATIRVGQIMPAAAVEPVSVASAGGLILLQQVGEFLCVSGQDLVLRPVLAESWTPNDKADVWTFKIRTGVKFHDGRPMSAKDVAASIARLADPQNSSNALSAFAGVLKPEGVSAPDDTTVVFSLDAPNGNFPYIVSSDNYNAIILPADYAGDFETTFNGTGSFKLERYEAKVGASFVRNEEYWGPKALPARTEFKFYSDIQPMLLALQGGEVDILQQVPVLAGAGIVNDPNFNVITLRSAAHQQLHMRNDMDPFKDKRVRRALALTLDRPSLVKGLMRGKAVEGNDSPFAPVFPSTDQTVAQRGKNIEEAKQLLEAAGMGQGFQVTLTTQRYLEIPEYAQLVQSAAREIGVTIDLNVLDQGAYYGDAVFGKSNWLDSVLGITDYGHRGVPNVYLNAPLKSVGTWNAAHFKNADYDRMVEGYVAAGTLEGQLEYSGQIQRLLLDETPVIFGYFYDFIVVSSKALTGAQPTAMSQMFLDQASLG